MLMTITEVRCKTGLEKYNKYVRAKETGMTKTALNTAFEEDLHRRKSGQIVDTNNQITR